MGFIFDEGGGMWGRSSELVFVIILGELSRPLEHGWRQRRQVRSGEEGAARFGRSQLRTQLRGGRESG